MYAACMCVCVAVSINIECIDTLGCRILSCGCKQILCVFLGCGGDKEAAASVRPSVRPAARSGFPACPSPLSCKLCTQFFFSLFSLKPPQPLPPFPLTHTIRTFLRKAAITSPRRRKRFSFAIFYLFIYFYFFTFRCFFPEQIRRCQDADKTASRRLEEPGGRFWVRRCKMQNKYSRLKMKQQMADRCRS